MTLKDLDTFSCSRVPNSYTLINAIATFDHGTVNHTNNRTSVIQYLKTLTRIDIPKPNTVIHCKLPGFDPSDYRLQTTQIPHACMTWSTFPETSQSRTKQSTRGCDRLIIWAKGNSHPLCPFSNLRHRPVCTSHSFAVLPATDQGTTIELKAIAQMLSLYPRQVLRHCPVWRSHSFMVWPSSLLSVRRSGK